MNVIVVIEELKKLYPDKNIIKNDESNPTEIICEIEPTLQHREKSVAISVIDQSIPHYHKKATEVYQVIKGKLALYINGGKHLLKEGDTLTINPLEVHYAEGIETWVKVYSHPGWTKEDHFNLQRSS